MKTINDINDMEQNADYDKEFTSLESTLINLKILRPDYHHTIELTARLSMKIASVLEINYDDSFVLASYYCNFGYIALEKHLYHEHYVTDNDKKLKMRHPHIGYNLLKEKGLEKSALYILYHHELPNGTGYQKDQNNNKLVACLNIADSFVEYCFSHSKPEPVLYFDEAYKLIRRNYRGATMFAEQEFETIEKILRSLYDKERGNV